MDDGLLPKISAPQALYGLGELPQPYPVHDRVRVEGEYPLVLLRPLRFPRAGYLV